MATIYYIQHNNLDIQINIYSPEIDTKLIGSLKNFSYPKEFNNLINIIKELSDNLCYKDNNISIQIHNGDARKYIKKLSNIHIVYQDAFSSDVNKELWTKEYFANIKRILAPNSIITTYSIATPIRLSMYENDLRIYEYTNIYTNKSTVALSRTSIFDQHNYKLIDMELKKTRNPTAKSLRD
ncbi:SAM-dependent methyltransferase [hydrothermal vent metagenome]|uniref:SAM-dependent methyltransferase n=1 Tax=hydrothermal vent metagenome TaxID=652676 RepID=A0A3B1EA78_9ZZZZ